MKIMTIGYGGLKPKTLVQLLQEHRVATVVDIRIWPPQACMTDFKLLKKKPGAPVKGIEGLFARAGVGYVSLLELGNPFFNDDWKERYSKWLNAAGDLATERLLDLPGPRCLLCCESKAEECHRAIVGDFLAQRGHEIHRIDTRAVLTEQALRRRQSSRREALTTMSTD